MLLSDSGICCIGDLGLARTLVEAPQESAQGWQSSSCTGLGTVAYLPPEALRTKLDKNGNVIDATYVHHSALLHTILS